jgi:hypothetical protein
MDPLRLLPEITAMGCGQLPRTPVATASRGQPEKIDAAAALLRVDPSLIVSPEAKSSAHPDKAGHPGAGSMLPWPVGEVTAIA